MSAIYIVYDDQNCIGRQTTLYREFTEDIIPWVGTVIKIEDGKYYEYVTKKKCNVDTSKGEEWLKDENWDEWKEWVEIPFMEDDSDLEEGNPRAVERYKKIFGD